MFVRMLLRPTTMGSIVTIDIVIVGSMRTTEISGGEVSMWTYGTALIRRLDSATPARHSGAFRWRRERSCR